MVNFRDSYFSVQWDLSKKHLSGTFWGKQYDTGRGFAVTVINGGQVVSPTTEVLRLKWEKPDKTSGYVNATIVNGKFVIENIDQMFTVHGSVRADFELSVAGEFVASITFYVSVEKAVAVGAIESSSQFTALQEALADVGDMQAQVDAVIANATVDSEVILARGAEPTLGDRLADIENGGLNDASIKTYTLSDPILKYIPTKLSDYTWELGGMYLGNDQVSTTRIRIKKGEYVQLKAGDEVTVGKNLQILLTLVNENKTYVTDTGWKTDKFTVITSGIYRLVVQKTAASNFTELELADIPKTFKLKRINWNTDDFVLLETIGEDKLKPIINRRIHYDLADLEWEQGSILNGLDTPGTNRMRVKNGQYLYLEQGDVVRVGQNKSIVPVCYDKNETFIGGDIANWNSQQHTISRNGYYRFVVEKGDASNFTSNEISLYPKNFSIKKKSVNQLHESIALKKQIEQSLPIVPIISDPAVETMTHASMVYPDKYLNDGTVWGVYYANDTATIESPSNTGTYINLVKFNLLNPSQVEKILAIKVNVPVGGHTIVGRAPYDPNLIIKEDKIIMIFNTYIDNKVTLGSLEFDKQTKVFSNYQTCKLEYTVGSTTNIVDFDVAGLKTAYEAITGVALTGNLGDLCVSTSFVEYNGYMYNTACEIFLDVGFKGMVIKTADGINYEVVAIPSSAPASAIESTIEIVGDKLIYAQRGGMNYITSYDLVNKTWSEWIHIPDMISSKNALVYSNAKLYLVYTSGDQLTTDWGKIQRSGFSIKEVDPITLSMKNVVDFQSPYGIHYPCLMKYKGNLYMSYSEDRKKLDLTQTRSNISFITLVLQ